MPEGAAVIDASPLILLSRIVRLDLLLTLGRRLVVPVPVLEEIHAKGEQDVGVQQLRGASYLEAVPPPAIPESVLRWDLGRGEIVGARMGDGSPRRPARRHGGPGGGHAT
jgi:predicted nucleic acid-binding protein